MAGTEHISMSKRVRLPARTSTLGLGLALTLGALSGPAVAGAAAEDETVESQAEYEYPMGVRDLRIALNGTGALLTWTDPVNWRESAVIGYRIKASNGAVIGEVALGTNSFQVPGALVPGHYYYFTVSAVTPFGEGSAYYTESLIRKTKPSKVRGLKAKKIKAKTAQIRWRPPANVGEQYVTYKAKMKNLSTGNTVNWQTFVSPALKATFGPRRSRIKIMVVAETSEGRGRVASVTFRGR